MINSSDMQANSFEKFFDAEWYLQQNPDVAQAGVDPFLHYMVHGWREGRDPHPEFDTSFYLENSPDVAEANENPLVHYVLFGEREGRKIRNEQHQLSTIQNAPTSDGSSSAASEEYDWDNWSFSSSSVEVENLARSDSESSTKGLIRAREGQLAWSIRKFIHFSAELSRKQGKIGAIILLPLFGRGGSEKVALSFAKLIRERDPDRAVLLLVTDYRKVDRSIPISNGIILASIFDFLDSGELERKQFLLRLIQMLRPELLHIINSDLGWQVVAESGERLGKLTRLFGSMFCTQRDYDTQQLIGYAASYFYPATKYCRAVMSDNAFFFEEAERLFLQGGAAKLQTIYNPTHLVEKIPNCPIGSRPAILWAGRLDKQKRVEVLFEIARQMPDVDFFFFGSTVTDGDITVEHLPNVFFEGPFTSPDELFSKRTYSLYIHTAREEGLPNLLLEIGARGLPIVAPAIGGIPELIRRDTGYLLSSWPSAEDYESSIREILSDEMSARARADNLRELIKDRHSWKSFCMQVLSVGEYIPAKEAV